ncbi:antigen B membrane protein [Elysia marginata]|uniref:Antigen B membrane protein n=1 Tax=Elysia marginata TaxID=1093978 RepID=A0AAV4I2J0_9GAST|nr:antigen B membrane protein [Elysia marginata]
MKRSIIQAMYLPGVRTLFLSTLMLTSMTFHVEADKFCYPGTKTPPVRLSNIFKKSFTAEIYQVDVKKRTSLRGHEHYSTKSKISAVYMSPTQDSAYTQFHIYYRNKKFGVSNIDSGSCEKVQKEPDFGLMSWKVSKMPDVSYVGTEEVSGEILHNWRACYSDDDFDYAEDLFTSQTEKEWGNPLGDDYTPVKMIRRLRNKKTSERSQVNFYFISFKARDDEDDDFKGDLNPPIGYTCSGSPVQKIPLLPQSIIYSSEPTDTPTKPIDYIVDSAREIIMSRGEVPGLNDQYKDLDSYKLGVTFKMPGDEENKCVITSYAVLGDKELNTSLSFKEAYHDKPFETVQQFLGYDDGFTFNGVHMFRGIQCIVFSKYYDNYRGSGETTVILYFSASKVKSYTSVGQLAISRPFLLRKDVWKNGQVMYEHNIYNAGSLDYSKLDYDPMDISECQEQLGAIELSLVFETKDSDSTSQSQTFKQRDELEKALKAQLALTTTVNELRVHMMDVFLQGGKLMAMARLLGPLTNEAHIMEVSGSIKDKSEVPAEKYIRSSYRWSVESCKRYLSRYDEANFASYCDDTCYLYKDIGLAELTEHTECTGLFLGKNRMEAVELDDAWKKLTDAVDSGTFKVNGFKASKVSKFDPSSVHNLTIPSLQRYEKTPGAKIETAMQTLKSTHLRDCSDSCTSSLGYQCEAFTYCEKENLCLLNPRPDDSGRQDVYLQAEKNCDVYVRKYVTEFTAMQLTSAAIDKEMVYEQIEDPNVCARLCLDLNDFRCESFDFCTLDGGAGSATCSLFRKHYFDIAESSQTVILTNTQCTHYARNYLGDYDRKEGITDLPIATTIRKSSPESCAQSCSQQDSSGEARCSMFQFCAIGGVCEFIDESSLVSDAQRLTPKLKKSPTGCATYSMKKNTYQIHGRSHSVRARASKAIRSKLNGDGFDDGGYGPGAMAVLAFGMLFLSSGLVLVGLFVWARSQRPGGLGFFSRGGAGKEMSMKFSKADFD